jgi:hypothetical protein
VLSWLIEAGVGPALVAVPVNWAADALADSARRWFGRIRRADGLSRLVAAAGQAVVLTPGEFRDVRQLLEDQSTWSMAGKGSVEDLAGLIASRIPPGGERTAEASLAAARVIARGVLEFAIADLDPAVFQQVLLARLQRMETNMASALDEAMLGLHADLAVQFAGQAAADGRRLDFVMGKLKQVLERLPPAPAERAEIAVYLRTLIDWLDTDPWPRDRRFGGHALAPAAIECKLRVRTTSAGSRSRSNADADNAYFDADFLADNCRRLVILGGPGSGKTWLARRIARRTAQEALSALASGADLEEVELPLYTTCSRLADAPGDIRAAIVSSALDQIGDLGGSRISTSVRAFLAERSAPTVLVIDSLDEARNADDRLRQADTLPWRVILTSRPGSWNSQLSIDGRDEHRRVGELQPLRYPEDVELLITRWFADTPAAGERLARQIAMNAGLQRSAAVPLILSFYCLIGGDAPLPDSRRHLYDKVIRRLLTGRWRSSGERWPDADACVQALMSWAWDGAVDNPVSRTGTWPDDIPAAPSGLPWADDSALDGIAMPVAPPDVDSGLTPRRFIHRSIREHLVAEHVASLPAAQAAEMLLPHLWYDEDWRYPGAMAIAAHPRRDDLLRDLLHTAGARHLPTVLEDVDVGWQMRGLLARVANESSEADWSPEIAHTIRQARLQLAEAGRPEDLDGTAGWPAAVRDERHALIRSLAAGTGRYESHVLENGGSVGYPDRGTGRAEPATIVNAIARLTLTGEDQYEIREAFLGLLPQISDGILFDGGLDDEPGAKTILARVIVRFCLAADDRYRTRSILLRALADPATDTATDEFIEGLIRLSKTEADKRQARQDLMELLAPENHPNIAAQLAIGISRLSPELIDKRQILPILLEVLERSVPHSYWSMPEVIDAIILFTESSVDKHHVRETIVRILTDQIDHPPVTKTAYDLETFWWYIAAAAPMLMDGVSRLDPSAEEIRQARALLLKVLDQQPSHAHMLPVASQLASLTPTQDERHCARQTVLRRIMSQGAASTGFDEIDSMIVLSADTVEEDETRSAILRRLRTHLHNGVTRRLADRLIKLAREPVQRQHLRQTLLQLLAADSTFERFDADYVAAELTDALAQLDPSPADSRKACQLLLLRIAHATPNHYPSRQLDHVVKLALASDERQYVSRTLLEVLAQPNCNFMADTVARAVAEVAEGSSEQGHICDGLFALLLKVADDPAPGTRSQASRAAALAEAIARLAPPEQHLKQTREILLGLLLGTTDNVRLGRPDRVYRAIELTKALSHLNPTAEERQQIRNILLLWIAAQTCPDRAEGQSTCDREVGDLADILLRFEPSDEDKHAARKRLITCLSAEHDGNHAKWQVHGLLSLEPRLTDLDDSGTWEHAPPTSLLTAMRANATLEDWLATLPRIAALTRHLYWGPHIGKVLET